MNNSMRTGLISVVIGIIVAILAFCFFFILKAKKDKLAREMRPRIWKAQFVLIGKQSSAQLGMRLAMDFRYAVVVEAKSELLSKEIMPTGEIELKKKRTFLNVIDSIVPSDADIVLDLESLPTKEFSKLVDATGVLLASLGANEEGTALIDAKNEMKQKAKDDTNGMGVRAWIEATGQKLQDELKNKLNEIGMDEMKKGLGDMESISGKSYLINYLLEENGQLSQIDYKNADGSDITEKEELMVLKRVNALMDYQLAHDKKSKPGVKWGLYADEMQELLAPFLEGKYSGEIAVERQHNAKNGDWVIDMHPSTITIISEGGSTTGKLEIEKGQIIMNPSNVNICIDEMFVNGRVNLEKLTRQYYFLSSKVDGWCRFKGRAITEEVLEE